MVVRFVPVPDSPEPAPGREHADLAEVIDFRSRLGAPGSSESARVALQSDASCDEMPEAGCVVSKLSSRASESSAHVNMPAEAIPTGPQQGVRQGREMSRKSDTPTQRERQARDAAVASEAPKRTAHEDGVRILARRAKSSGEVARELGRMGHPAHEIEIVIAEFTESLYLDDLSLAHTLTERLRDTKGASRGQIRAKLRERLLEDTAIETALGGLDDDSEVELLRQAANDRARKLGALDRATAERRLLAYLSRRGWSGQSLHGIVREALDAASPQRGVRFE